MHLEKIILLLLFSVEVSFCGSCRRKVILASNIDSGCIYNSKIVCDSSSKYSNLDGSCNNLANPYYGKAGTPLGRLLTPVYDDGSNSPKTSGLPNPRKVSLALNSDNSSVEPTWTHLWMVFGQFLAHDFSFTPQIEVNGVKPVCNECEASDDNCFPIPIDSSDALGITCMPFVRSTATVNLNCSSDQREQLNLVTSFIDAGQVYGSNVAKSNSLRTMEGGNFNF